MASDFLKRRMETKYLNEIHAVEEEKRRKIEAEKEKYNILSAEEKHKRLLDGLYSYEWSTSGVETIGLS